MSEDNKEVFRGHLEECFQHLKKSLDSKAPKGSRGALTVKKPIADFCGVGVSSVARWFRRTGLLPIGETLIKLMCYLDMAGYRVIELERMPKGRRGFVELLGYGLLSGDKAIELLGYSENSTLLKVLQGHHGTSKDKEQKMWDFWKEKKEELEKTKEELQKQFGSRSLGTKSKVLPRTNVSKVSDQHVSATRQIAVVSIMEGLLKLLEEDSFGKLTNGNLAALQKSADTVLRLSAHLSALSSRLIMTDQRGKGGGNV
jgi:hypothetical protein